MSQSERERALRDAAKAFVEKLDLCMPAINGAFTLQHIHGINYSGPNFGEELAALRAALDTPQEPTPTARCDDCGLEYGTDDWLDTVLTREDWLKICPDSSGLLCANCIVRRASKLPGIVALNAYFYYGNEGEIPHDIGERIAKRFVSDEAQAHELMCLIAGEIRRVRDVPATQYAAPEPTPAPSEAEVEAGQRKRLKERLAGRPRPPREAFEDIGIPMLNEWADDSVPTIETSHEQPTPAENSFALKDAKIYQAALPVAPPDALPMAVYGVPSTTGKFLVWTGDSKEKAEWMADGSRPVIEYQRAAAPRPALSPEELARKIGYQCFHSSVGNHFFKVDLCAEILKQYWAAPREGSLS